MNAVLPLVAGASSLLASGAVLYRCIRPRFPVTVNCHFCDKDTQVPYGNQNCWDCPSCEQYNGFSLDGDYNKPIPAQYAEDMNHPISAEQRPPVDFASSSVLCDQCTRNQLLKVKQLANFVSYEESNYDAEVDAYQTHLEHVYRLCRACEKKVDRCLRKQDDFLHRKLSESGSPGRLDLSSQDMSFTGGGYCILPTPWYVRLMRLTVLLCAFVVLIGNAHNLAQYLDVEWWPVDVVPVYIIEVLDDMYLRNWFLVFTALFLNIGAIAISGKERLTSLDAMSCFLWLSLTLLQSHVAGRWLPVLEVYRMQPLLALVTTAVSLWCALCPRYLRSASPKRIRTRRLRPDSSYASSASPSPPRGARSRSAVSESWGRPVTSQAASEMDGDGGPTFYDSLDELETLSIGEPMRLNDRGPFLSSPAQRVPVTPSGRNGLNHIRQQQQRPIISPARFAAAQPAQPRQQATGPTGPSGSRYVRQHSFGLPKKRAWNSNNSASSQRQLFQSSSGQLFQSSSGQLNTSFLGNGSFLGGSQAFDDRASMFSEPRHRHDSDSSASSSDSFVSQSRASTACPVDTTFSEVEQPPIKEVRQERSLISSLVWGLSIGLNISLVLYFFVDRSTWVDIASLLL